MDEPEVVAGAEGAEAAVPQPLATLTGDNSWETMRLQMAASMAEVAAGAAADPAAVAPDEGDEEGAADEEEEGEEDEQPDGDDDADEEEEEEEEEPEPKGGKPRFTVVAADGKPAAIQWPEGAAIRFKADGQVREARSTDELVEWAQQGLAALNREPEHHRRVNAARHEAETAARLAAALEQEIEKGEETLLKVLFDREARQRVREALRDYRSPVAREAAREQARKARREALDAGRAEAAANGQNEQFWEVVGNEASKQISGHAAEFPYLSESDLAEIVEQYHLAFQEQRQQILTNAERHAAAIRGDRDAARLQGERLASRWLTVANLRETMRVLNEHYAERASRVHGTPPSRKPAPPTADPARAVQQHNTRVERALTPGAPPVRSNGAPTGQPPAAAATPEGDGTAWQRLGDRIRGEFAGARR